MNYVEQLELDKYTVDVRAKICDYDLSGNFGIGYTAQGDVFYFDKEDYEKIKDYPWHKYNNGYFTARIRINGKRRGILLHRAILNPPEKLLVDHIGGAETKHDNRKCNLRIVNNSQNTINQNRMPNNKSGYVGLRYRSNKWESQIKINGVAIHLGYFKTYEDAVAARVNAEKKYFGEYSYSESQKESRKWQ